jgi:hypothetical protein
MYILFIMKSLYNDKCASREQLVFVLGRGSPSSPGIPRRFMESFVVAVVSTIVITCNSSLVLSLVVPSYTDLFLVIHHYPRLSPIFLCYPSLLSIITGYPPSSLVI